MRVSESDARGEGVSDAEADSVREGLGERVSLAVEECDTEPETLPVTLTVTLTLREARGEGEAESEPEADAESLRLGDAEAECEAQGVGEREGGGEREGRVLVVPVDDCEGEVVPVGERVACADTDEEAVAVSDFEGRGEPDAEKE